jgi:ribosomal protein L11
MIAWLKAYAKTHIFYIVLIAVGLIAFRSWLQEHDARQAADNTVKQQEAQVADLKQQIVTANQQAAQKVQVVTKIVHDAVTPSQVVAAIPSLTNVPLNTREVPGNPTDVLVAAQPLIQLAGDDKAAHIQLEACQQVGALKDQQLTAKDVEIAALKKKPSFWKRVLGTAKAVGVGVGIGLLLSTHV